MKLHFLVHELLKWFTVGPCHLFNIKSKVHLQKTLYLFYFLTPSPITVLLLLDSGGNRFFLGEAVQQAVVVGAGGVGAGQRDLCQWEAQQLIQHTEERAHVRYRERVLGARVGRP